MNIMKNLRRIRRTVADAFMHYVCMRLQFRSHILGGSFPLKKAEPCIENCCPAKG